MVRMVVNREALWILLVACSVIGVACMLQAQLRRELSESSDMWRRRPFAFIGSCVDAVLTGAALGMSATFLVFVAAAVVVRLS